MTKTPVCPKCGSPGTCFHDGDVSSGPSYYDQYRFECGNPKCRFADRETVYGGDSGGNNYFTECPYCGASA